MMKRLLAAALSFALTVAPVYAQEGRAVGPNPTATGQAATGQIPGTTTNDNATAGNVGEYRSASGSDTGLAQAGGTVTITIASPAVVTFPSIPFAFNGAGAAVINFTTTGALPTGIVAGTNYYVIGSSVSGNNFQIATSADNAIAGTAINTSGSQSGVHTGNPTVILGTGTGANVAAMSLTAGDWEVSGTIGFIAAGSTSIARQVSSLSTVSATKDQVPNRMTQLQTATQVPGVSNTIFIAGPARFSLASTTTIYCVAFADFTVSTLAAWGGCHARRAR